MNVLMVPTIVTTGLTVPIPKPVSPVNANQERENSFISLVNDNKPIRDQIEISASLRDRKSQESSIT